MKTDATQTVPRVVHCTVACGRVRAVHVIAALGAGVVLIGIPGLVARDVEDPGEQGAGEEAGVRRRSDPPVIHSSWDDLLEGVATEEEWRSRREEIRRRFLELIRDEAKPARPPLDLREHDRVVVDGVYERRLVSYAVEPDERAHAYLAIPLERPAGERLPAVVALHGTFSEGKDRAAGLVDSPDKAWLDQLARRGYVVIAPDHFVAGERIPPEGAYDTSRFHERHPDWTAVGKFTFEHSIAIDVLESLESVDRERIGALGHSLGGQGTIFLAAYDERVRVAASNCSAPFFRHNSEVEHWSRDRWYVYLKPLRERLLRGELPPIDFHEIIALIAPRAFLDVSGLNDGDPLTQRQRALMNLKIMDVYDLVGRPEGFGFFMHGRGHSAAHESRELIFGWMDVHLKPAEATAASLVGVPALGRVETTLVDAEAHGYATFQSHNQKVAAGPGGIFMTHLRSRNADYTAQQWRLSRSTDGGLSFETVYEATDATNPPAIEIGGDGTVYLGRPDFVDGNAYLYRFRADDGFRSPQVTAIPGGAAGKYAMVLDGSRSRLFWFAHNDTFHEIDPDGNVVRKLVLTAPGANAALQYPHLSPGRDGALHAAWTTQRHGVYLYHDIHHASSADGGETWRNLDGNLMTPPIVADDTGPAARITLDDEFDAHTWLSSFTVTPNAAHFLYLAQTDPPRQHYVRVSLADGRREIDLHPAFGDGRAEIHGLDGFFAQDARGGGMPVLYAVGRDRAGHVVCLASRDEGLSWSAHAKSRQTYNGYSIGGWRQVTADGWIIGSFTDQRGDTATNDRGSRVYFFRIRAGG